MVHFKPFESALVQRLEVFNELTTILLFGIIYCFTALTPHSTHPYVGLYFMFTIIFNISIHLFFLIMDVVVKLIAICKKYKYRGVAKP